MTCVHVCALSLISQLFTQAQNWVWVWVWVFSSSRNFFWVWVWVQLLRPNFFLSMSMSTFWVRFEYALTSIFGERDPGSIRRDILISIEIVICYSVCTYSSVPRVTYIRAYVRVYARNNTRVRLGVHNNRWAVRMHKIEIHTVGIFLLCEGTSRKIEKCTQNVLKHFFGLEYSTQLWHLQCACACRPVSLG